jgi:hypothetical protein
MVRYELAVNPYRRLTLAVRQKILRAPEHLVCAKPGSMA